MPLKNHGDSLSQMQLIRVKVPFSVSFPPLGAEATDIPHKHFNGNGLHGAPWRSEFGATGHVFEFFQKTPQSILSLHNVFSRSFRGVAPKTKEDKNNKQNMV